MAVSSDEGSCVYLQDLLVFLGMCLFHLFSLDDVVLQISNSMLVGLKSLEEQAGCLAESLV